MIRHIHRDFFEVLTRGGTWKEMLDGYLSPNWHFFRPYPREVDSPLGRSFRNDDATGAMEQVSLHEMIVEEGLAFWTGSTAAPEVPLRQTLFYFSEDFRWCEENLDLLWKSFQAHKNPQLGNEGFKRWFGMGPENGYLPPRSG